MSNQLFVSAKSESTIEPIPEGLHFAVCASMYDVGTIYNEEFEKHHRKIVIGWEFPELPKLTFEKDGKKSEVTRSISRRFTLSLHEKAQLRHITESWRGRKFTEEELAKFDIAKVLGMPCQIQIMHVRGKEGQTYANVANVLPASKSDAGYRKADPIFFSVTQLTEPVLPPTLPEWIGKLVVESREWERLQKRASAPKAEEAAPEVAKPDPADDDVPF